MYKLCCRGHDLTVKPAAIDDVEVPKSAFLDVIILLEFFPVRQKLLGDFMSLGRFIYQQR